MDDSKATAPYEPATMLYHYRDGRETLTYSPNGGVFII